MIQKNPLFPSNDPKYAAFRQGIFSFIEVLNRVARDPFDQQQDIHAKIMFLPIHWNPEQIYLVFESLYVRKIFSDMCILNVNEKNVIVEFMIIHAVQMDDLNSPHTPFLEFSLLQLNDVPEHKSFIQEINQDIQNNVSIMTKVHDFIRKEFKIKNIFVFLFPYNVYQLLTNLNAPLLNLDALDFYNFLIESYHFGKNFAKNSKFNYILPNLDSSHFLYRIVKAAISQENVDLDKWAKIWVNMLDGISMNSIIILNNQPALAIKTIVENDKMSINPIPLYLLKPFLGSLSNPKVFAKQIAQKTGVRTVVIQEKDLMRFLEYTSQPDYDVFEFLSQLSALFYSSPWGPDSLLNSFFRLFGMELGTGIHQVPLALKKTIEYFETVLIIVFNSSESSTGGFGTIAEIVMKNGKPALKLIESEKFQKQFASLKGDMVDKFRNIKDFIEKELKIHYSIGIGLDVNILSDSVSARNIQSLVGVSSITKQLPMIASLGGLFAAMKALEVDDAIDKPTEPILELKESTKKTLEESPEKMKFQVFYDEFLKKGVMCIIDENKSSLKKFRSPIYSAQGFLGLDMTALKELMATKSKK